MPEGRRKALLRWLPRAVGVLILVYIIHRIGLSTPRRLLSRLGWPVFLGVLALNLPHIAFKALRWRTLLRRRGGHYPFLSALHAYFAGIAMGIVTPARAGEFFKALYPVRAGVVNMPSSLAMVLADRVYDLGFLLLLSALASLYVLPAHTLLMAGLGTLVAVVLGLLGWRRVDSLVLGLTRRWRIAEEDYGTFKDGLVAGVMSPWIPALLTLGGYLVMNAQVYWIAHRMGISIGFVELVLLFSLANTVALLPLSLSGLGTREAALGFIFYLTGRPEAEGIALALAFFLMMAFPVTVLGSVALLAGAPRTAGREPRRTKDNP